MAALCVVVLNRKGGVGKTSTCFHLAGTLAQGGRRVLLIDTDPQANLTEGLLGARVAEEIDPTYTVAALFQDAFLPDPSGLIRPTPFPGVHLLPGSEAMEEVNEPRPAGNPRQTALRDFVGDIRDAYDVILIDCPPSMQLSSWASLVAGDGVLVPVQVEDFGGQGLKKINRALAQVRAEVNPGLILLGYLVTMYNKSLAIHAAYAEQLRAAYGELVFETAIPLSTDYKVAVTSGTPIALLKPRSIAAKAMSALAEELLARANAAMRKEVA
ncbi:MAG: ParA family protein [Isosphaeraceae bacterium]|nr:ParA family protein [Isosphaeraceae bacterium]